MISGDQIVMGLARKALGDMTEANASGALAGWNHPEYPAVVIIAVGPFAATMEDAYRRAKASTEGPEDPARAALARLVAAIRRYPHVNHGEAQHEYLAAIAEAERALEDA